MVYSLCLHCFIHAIYCRLSQKDDGSVISCSTSDGVLHQQAVVQQIQFTNLKSADLSADPNVPHHRSFILVHDPNTTENYCPRRHGIRPDEPLFLFLSTSCPSPARHCGTFFNSQLPYCQTGFISCRASGPGVQGHIPPLTVYALANLRVLLIASLLSAQQTKENSRGASPLFVSFSLLTDHDCCFTTTRPALSFISPDSHLFVPLPPPHVPMSTYRSPTSAMLPVFSKSGAAVKVSSIHCSTFL